jgi:hypothetical protein
VKLYYYKPEELGVEKWKPGIMRPKGFDITENPKNADVFCLPAIMHHFPKQVLLDLKYLPGNERRHFLWDCADNFRTFDGIPWNAIRCCTTKRILKEDPTTIAWPWPVEPLPRRRVEEILAGQHTMHDKFGFDVSFWGWNTPLELTGKACDSISHLPPVARAKIKALIHRNKFFFGYRTKADDDYEELHSGFVASLWESRTVLVPASIDGVIRYRLLEQVSMGRGLPVHICDNVVMPWADRIEWDLIVPKLNVDWEAAKGKHFDHTGLSCPEAMVDQVGPLLVEWLREHSDAEILERAKYGQAMFNAWLHRDRWNELFGIAIRERMAGKI